jgi:hypothetical protein
LERIWRAAQKQPYFAAKTAFSPKVVKNAFRDLSAPDAVATPLLCKATS